MILSQQINDAINQQIAHELRNQQAYLQIGSYFEDLELTNISEYFFKQADHEKDHAKMFIDHLNCRIGGKVKIGEVPEFTETLISPTHAGEVYVLIEAGTTESIEAILELIIENKSFIDQPFILKMLEEQVEEEDSANRFEVLIRNCKDLVLFNANFDDVFGGD